jgi:hypothetical protein
MPNDEVDTPPAVRVGLEPLIRGAPAMLGVAAAAAPLCVLRFRPDVAAGLRSGAFHLMGAVGGGHRPMAVNAANKIVGLPTVHSTSELQLVSAGMAVWQVMAVVTAQRFLVDINRRLANIERGIQDIKDWLDDDRLAKLLGNLAYLRSASHQLKDGPLTQADATSVAFQIDAVDRECTQVLEAYRIQMTRAFSKFDGVQLEGMGIKKHVDEAAKAVVEAAMPAHRYLAAAYVRGLAARLRCAVLGNPRVAARRLEEVRACLDQHAEEMGRFDSRVKKRLPEVWSLWSEEDTQKQLRRKLKRKSVDLQKQMLELRDDLVGMLDDAMAAIESHLTDEGQPLELMVVMDSNERLVRLLRRSGQGEED